MNTNVSPTTVTIKVGNIPIDIQQITIRNNPMDNIGIHNSQITSQNVCSISKMLVLKFLMVANPLLLNYQDIPNQQRCHQRIQEPLNPFD